MPSRAHKVCCHGYIGSHEQYRLGLQTRHHQPGLRLKAPSGSPGCVSRGETLFQLTFRPGVLISLVSEA